MLQVKPFDALRPRLPRWERFLRMRGHASVPNLQLARQWYWAEIRAGNDINLLINEAAKNQRMAHELRNLTGTRPHKA